MSFAISADFIASTIRALEYFDLIRSPYSGLLVIGDVKRGDIDSTAAAYAAAFLDPATTPAPCDAVTLSPFLGGDSIAPFLEACARHAAGIFVLVRTSNPGGADFQHHGEPALSLVIADAVHAWGAPITMLLLWTGWTVGGMGTYAVGRWLGRPVVKAMISDATLDQFEHRITTRAPFGLVLLFQFALPSEVPGSVLGLVRYSFAKYMAALTITELPYAVGTVYLGESFLEQRTFLIVGIGAAGAIVSAWALIRLRKRLST